MDTLSDSHHTVIDNWVHRLGLYPAVKIIFLISIVFVNCLYNYVSNSVSQYGTCYPG